MSRRATNKYYKNSKRAQDTTETIKCVRDPHKLDFKVRKLSLFEEKDLTFSKLLERWYYHRSTKKWKNF